MVFDNHLQIVASPYIVKETASVHEVDKAKWRDVDERTQAQEKENSSFSYAVY